MKKKREEIACKECGRLFIPKRVYYYLCPDCVYDNNDTEIDSLDWVHDCYNAIDLSEMGFYSDR